MGLCKFNPSAQPPTATAAGDTGSSAEQLLEVLQSSPSPPPILGIKHSHHEPRSGPDNGSSVGSLSRPLLGLDRMGVILVSCVV